MKKSEQAELAKLIPLWNEGNRAAINRVAEIINPWILDIAEIKVCKKHSEINVSSDFSLNTGHLLIDADLIRQLVGVALSKYQHSGQKLTTPAALNQMLRTITHNIVINQLKSPEVTSRVPYSTEQKDEDQEVSLDDGRDAIIFLLERVAALTQIDPEKATCYAMNKIELIDTATIAEIMSLSVRTVQRHIKIFGVDLKIHFDELLED